jgi:hypothetical protein
MIFERQSKTCLSSRWNRMDNRRLIMLVRIKPSKQRSWKAKKIKLSSRTWLALIQLKLKLKLNLKLNLNLYSTKWRKRLELKVRWLRLKYRQSQRASKKNQGHRLTSLWNSPELSTSTSRKKSELSKLNFSNSFQHADFVPNSLLPRMFQDCKKGAK